MRDVHIILTFLLDMLFPRSAAVARFDRIPGEVLARTAVRTMVRTVPPCLAPLPYDNTLVRSTIHAVKYHGHERAASLLGEVLAPFIAEELAERRMLGTFHRPLLIPLPLHHKRQRERGYNQAERIADALLVHLTDEHIALDTGALVRTRATTTQTQQADRRERMKNMQGAFAVPEPARVAHRDIILLDDVITTGATLGAAKKALMAAGARDVLCVAVAH